MAPGAMNAKCPVAVREWDLLPIIVSRDEVGPRRCDYPRPVQQVQRAWVAPIAARAQLCGLAELSDRDLGAPAAKGSNSGATVLVAGADCSNDGAYLRHTFFTTSDLDTVNAGMAEKWLSRLARPGHDADSRRSGTRDRQSIPAPPNRPLTNFASVIVGTVIS